jgi:DNA polymerase III epsilon subunit-like protein
MFMVAGLVVVAILVLVVVLAGEKPDEATEAPMLTGVLSDFLEAGGDLVVFDLETNGLSPATHSVLSVAAIRCKPDPETLLDPVDVFERYYYPVEECDRRAIAKNGLTKEVLDAKREGVEYPEHFKDDPAFEKFCEGCSLFVGHNLSFDAGFVPFVKAGKPFCTMKSNTDILQLPKDGGGWKYPTLGEVAEYYDVDFDSGKAHDAMYDTRTTMMVFLKMMVHAGIKPPLAKAG